MTLVANCPNGENLGPDATRATNPSASGHSSHSVRKIRVRMQSATTMPATDRAAYSLTGFGNLSNFVAALLIWRTHCSRRDVIGRRRPRREPGFFPGGESALDVHNVGVSPRDQLGRDRP